MTVICQPTYAQSELKINTDFEGGSAHIIEIDTAGKGFISHPAAIRRRAGFAGGISASTTSKSVKH